MQLQRPVVRVCQVYTSDKMAGVLQLFEGIVEGFRARGANGRGGGPK